MSRAKTNEPARFPKNNQAAATTGAAHDPNPAPVLGARLHADAAAPNHAKNALKIPTSAIVTPDQTHGFQTDPDPAHGTELAQFHEPDPEIIEDLAAHDRAQNTTGETAYPDHPRDQPVAQDPDIKTGKIIAGASFGIIKPSSQKRRFLGPHHPPNPSPMTLAQETSNETRPAST